MHAIGGEKIRGTALVIGECLIEIDEGRTGLVRRERQHGAKLVEAGIAEEGAFRLGAERRRRDQHHCEAESLRARHRRYEMSDDVRRRLARARGLGAPGWDPAPRSP